MIENQGLNEEKPESYADFCHEVREALGQVRPKDVSLINDCYASGLTALETSIVIAIGDFADFVNLCNSNASKALEAKPNVLH